MRNIAVVGCGPAGLAFAAALSDSDHHITILERSAETRAKGSGFVLQPNGLAMLDRLGIRAELEALGHRIERIVGIATRNNRCVIDVDYRLVAKDSYALGLHRSVLFDILMRRAKLAGTKIVTNAKIGSYEKLADGKLLLRDQQQHTHGPFDFVVDASGARSALRAAVFKLHSSRQLKFGSLWTTLDADERCATNKTLQMRYGRRDRSVGVMPIGRSGVDQQQRVAFFSAVECSSYDALRAAGLDAWKRGLLDDWPQCIGLLEQIKSFEQLTLARYQHHTVTRPWRPGFVLIGDAAHAASPQLGQGVNMGIVDALTLADALREHRNPERAMRQYAARRRWHVRVVQTVALLLQPMYQSDFGSAIALRDWLFQPALRLPHMRRLIALIVAGMITNPIQQVR